MKILFVSTISNTVNTFLIPYIKFLFEQGHQVDVAFNIVQEVNPELAELGCVVHSIDFQRFPFNRKNRSAYKKLKKLIQNEGYHLVHTHTPVASACSRIACRNIKEVKVIYTAHGFHFFKGAPVKNWLLYYPVERWLARYTDLLITINKEDYTRANKSFKAGRVEYIPGVGLDTKKFSKVVVDKVAKRRELGIPETAFVALSVGELNKNKNHETLVKAIAKLNNSNVYYVICGIGPKEGNIKKLIQELGIEKQVKLLGYRRDIDQIYKISNVFVFPSFREGLSVALMEAMSSGVPVVCSDIRGNKDLINKDKGGYLVNPLDIDMFALAISKLINDTKLCTNMGLYNKERIKSFDIKIIRERMKKLYNV